MIFFLGGLAIGFLAGACAVLLGLLVGLQAVAEGMVKQLEELRAVLRKAEEGREVRVSVVPLPAAVPVCATGGKQ